MHPSPLSQSSLDQASNSKIQLFQKLPDTSYPFQIQSLTFHKVEGNLGLGQYAPLSQIAWRSTVGWNEKYTADHDFLMSYIFGFLKMNLTSFKKYLHTGIGEILDLKKISRGNGSFFLSRAEELNFHCTEIQEKMIPRWTRTWWKAARQENRNRRDFKGSVNIYVVITGMLCR